MTAEPLPPEIDDGKHTMVMKFMDDGWADAITDLRAPIQMPFFVGGEAFERMEQKHGITLNSYMMMCGILITWFTPDSMAWVRGRTGWRNFYWPCWIISGVNSISTIWNS